MNNIKKFKCFLDDNYIIESIKNANKIISDFNIDTNNSDFIKIKDLLKKNPNLFGTFLNFRFNPDENIPISSIIKVINWINTYKQLISNLSKNIVDYDTFEELEDDISHLNRMRIVNEFYKSLYKKMRDEISNLNKDDKDELDNIVYSFMIMPEEKRNGFIPLKYFKMNNIKLSDFKKSLIDFIENGKLKFETNTILDKLKDCEGYEILYNKGNILLIRTNNKDTVVKLGSQKWCIVYSSENYAESYYGKNTFNTQFILWNFNLPEYISKSQFGITLNKNGEPVSGGCQDKNNNYVNFDEILESTGLSKQDFELDLDYYNKYTTFLENIKNLYNDGKIVELLDKINNNDIDISFNTILKDLSIDKSDILYKIYENANYKYPIIEIVIKNDNLSNIFSNNDYYSFFNKLSNIESKYNPINILQYNYVKNSYYKFFSSHDSKMINYYFKMDKDHIVDISNSLSKLKNILNDLGIFNEEVFNFVRHHLENDYIDYFYRYFKEFESFSDLLYVLEMIYVNKIFNTRLDYIDVNDFISDNNYDIFLTYYSDDDFKEYFKNNIDIFSLSDILSEADLYYKSDINSLKDIINMIPNDYLNDLNNNAIKYFIDKKDYMESIGCKYDKESDTYYVEFGDWSSLDGDYFEFTTGYSMENLYEMWDYYNDYHPGYENILYETSYAFKFEVFRYLLELYNESEFDIDFGSIELYLDVYNKYKNMSKSTLNDLYKNTEDKKEMNSISNYIYDIVENSDNMEELGDLSDTLRDIYQRSDAMSNEDMLFSELLDSFIETFNIKEYNGKKYKYINDKLCFNLGNFYEFKEDGYLYEMLYNYGATYDIYDIFSEIVIQEGRINIPENIYGDWSKYVQEIEFEHISF